MIPMMALLLLLWQAPERKSDVVTFHHCHLNGGSGNTPHLFDVSEIYKCDEGRVEIAGQDTKVVEYGYVYEQTLGRPVEAPRRATMEDYKSDKWCPDPVPQDPSQMRRCGDVRIKCYDGKLSTWDPSWQGHSCVTPDHK